MFLLYLLTYKTFAVILRIRIWRDYKTNSAMRVSLEEYLLKKYDFCTNPSISLKRGSTEFEKGRVGVLLQVGVST